MQRRSFADEVREFMERWGYLPSELGRAALKDPNFVGDLLLGNRSPTERTIRLVRAFMRGGARKHAPENRHGRRRRRMMVVEISHGRPV